MRKLGYRLLVVGVMALLASCTHPHGVTDRERVDVVERDVYGNTTYYTTQADGRK